MDQKPVLIEPGVKYFLSSTLKECRKFKDKHISIIFNISMTLLLFIIVGGFLLYRYKGYRNIEEEQLKQRKKHEYIISKLQNLALLKQQQYKENNMITGEPMFPHTPSFYEQIYK
jgi:hypothetical protein